MRYPAYLLLGASGGIWAAKQTLDLLPIVLPIISVTSFSLLSVYSCIAGMSGETTIRILVTSEKHDVQELLPSSR
jgi:hypothetical protein